MFSMQFKHKKMDKKEKSKQVHEDLDGFNVRINPFGQIESNFDMDKVNEFLNQNTEDKKIKGGKKPATEEEEWNKFVKAHAYATL